MGSVQVPMHSFAAQARSHLPASILDFLKSHSTSNESPPSIPVESQEPPRKRKRVSTAPPTAPKEIKPIQFIVLRWTTINITFPKPQGDSDPNVHYQSINPIRISLSKIGDQKFNIGIRYALTWNELEVQGKGGPTSLKLLNTEIDAAELPLLDVELAMLKDVDWFRSSGQGRLWTDTTVTLHRRDDSDHLALSIGLKWEKTETPLHIPAWSARPMLQKCLDKYLPGLSDDEDDGFVHTPQSFYKCAHTPHKDDPVALSLKTPAVRATLYPFQKRAVQWLLKREGVQWCSSGVVAPFKEEEDLGVDGLPPSFTKVFDDEGTELFFSSQMNLATTNIAPFQNSEPKLRGGLLAEEMGLGKTVEMISLITLHKSPLSGRKKEIDGGILPIRVTLLVVPSSLLSQWISEFEHHSPGLKVLHYRGLKNSKLSSDKLRQTFAAQDVVITTYDVLSSEVHFARPPPDRQMRQDRKYERKTSPLPRCQWWRVCLDEAQMIHGGISAAAQVATMIPRINAWGISGTPVKRGIADLHALLKFLKFEPYSSNFNLWSHLLHSPRNFARCLNKIALRHTKKSVRDELELPPQKRFVITMPFTPIEEQHYQSLFQAMAAECNMDVNGNPLDENMVPNYVKMRQWLVRLRQTALHPEVGGHNRRALGRDGGPLRTLDEIVVTMLDNTDQKIRADERSRLISQLKRGQMLENGPRINEALELWSRAVEESLAVGEEIRKQLDQEKRSAEPSSKSQQGYADGDEEDRQNDESTKLGTLRNRLRSALEVQHMAVFFQANAFFQLREKVDADGPEAKELEKKEVEGYERAKALRHEILQDILGRASRLMGKISKNVLEKKFTSIPRISFAFRGRNDLGSVEGALRDTSYILTLQADQIIKWRDSLIKLLTKSLVDEDDGVEMTGNEYEDSTKTQDEIFVLVMAIRTLVSDRHELLSGQHNRLIEVEVKSSLDLAKDGKGHYPEKTIELLNIRQRLLPGEEIKSLRAIVAETRSLVSNSRGFDGNNRNRAEIAEDAVLEVQEQLNLHTKVNAALELELELFTSAMNARVEFYRQLQQVSDTVAPYEGEVNDFVIENKIAEEEDLKNGIAAAKIKRRYFSHLQTEALSKETRICVICQDQFERGVFTKCGHTFCKDDFKLWWTAHRNCPTCKQRLVAGDVFNIICKSQILQGQADSEPVDGERSPTKSPRKSKIYNEISEATLTQIKDINFGGNSTFTTKVDTLAKHIIWLRTTDPGAKSIVFCQYKEFLNVLSLAFDKYKIGHDSIDKKGGIDRFKDDPSKEVFLLPARAHSSGLNLVNASHVFLCEPLLQTALELQAIARVDRIGQKQATTVWLYLIDGTVEESIYDISVARRLEHMDRSKTQESPDDGADPDVLEESNIEQSNALQLQEAGELLMKKGTTGEVVPDSELWKCLFGSRVRAQGQGQVLDVVGGANALDGMGL